MKQNETKQKERYESPAVLDLAPVTVSGEGQDSPPPEVLDEHESFNDQGG